jgi:hypothetical protein
MIIWIPSEQCENKSERSFGKLFPAIFLGWMLKFLHDVKMSTYTFLNRMSLVIFQTA